MEDQYLIEGLERGDKGAFEALFKKYYSSLVLFATRLVPDKDMARELVQDVFVTFYEKRQEIRIHTSLKSHLYQSVRNRCINYIKREINIRGHHAEMASEMKLEEEHIESSIHEVELEQRIYQVIKELPDKCREVFEMSRFEGLSNQDIADRLEISKRTVETQISKALRILRENLTDREMILLILILISYESLIV
jgi:RNA polymerase sigma-70 factor (family 1)